MGNGAKVPLHGGLNHPLYSRPLKTGQKYTLVVHEARVHHLAWDRTGYEPGDTCKLSLAGMNLGKGEVEVVVEAEQDGGWAPLETVKANIDAGQSGAVAEWKVPIPPGHAEAVAEREKARLGSLVRAAWAQQEVAEGSALDAQIEVEGMEGEKLVVLVEREHADGSWRCVGHDEGQIQSGKCAVSWTPPAEARPPRDGPEPPPAELTGCKFEDGAELGPADTAWLKVNCAGMEHETVQLVLEEEKDGGWSEVSSAVSTVKAGEARTGIPIEKK